ncbi:unnamed protein product [Clonostachys rosea f. rosea IK726]|uniref:Uncharacterized protein n=1 Tax=Clonostachys rosea f. rosea IK726 TaxID=1349383 RepID=A0ACA9UL99_BIOOC|nr:unnamed protein product [Clonostachys rosea f. rosea IK726]
MSGLQPEDHFIPHKQAMSEHAKIPSVAKGPIRTCKLGVNRKGTGSGFWKNGFVELMYDINSDPQMLPDPRAMLIFCGYLLCI